jgi:5-methylcytosine-specific restriction endonuclease McrA
LCKTHAKIRADQLFSVYVRVRDGMCQAEGEHQGGLQCAHLIPRRYLAVRWDPKNAVALCAGHHTFFTHRPLEWEGWVNARLGKDYLKLRGKALDGTRPDLAHVIAYLEAA